MAQSIKKNETEEVVVTETAAPDEERVYVYVGPSISGTIQNGSIYFGTRKQVLDKLANALEKYPKIKHLVVLDTAIIETKAKIKAGNNTAANAYKALASQK